MTLDRIKTELAGLPEAEQDYLVAYLVHLRHSRDPRIGQETAQKIDDHEASHWLSVEQLKEHWKE